jgi:hypothetical protein
MADSSHMLAAPEAPRVRMEEDFHAWLLDQASALRQQHYAAIDWSNLAEELEGMARKDRKELRSHLQNLFVHLLKWAYEPERRSNSWKATINASRDNIQDLLEESPSLRSVLGELLAESKAYSRAVRDAVEETEKKVQFPMESPWTLDQLLDSDFLPTKSG